MCTRLERWDLILSFCHHTQVMCCNLDVACFKPFKFAFKAYKNVQTLANKGKGADKEDLTQWMFLVIKKALNPHNICKRIQDDWNMAT